ncbi:MAG: hypothetical protein KF743_14140 [Fimbriimonadaceae bacterium]|nr:hypothetical protein [Fimbriimonadaceae bacterium]
MRAGIESIVGSTPASRVHIRNARRGLATTQNYWWIDGQSLPKAKYAFAESGLVDVWFCRECGCRHDDIEKSCLAGSTQDVIVESSYGNAQLFVTDLSPCVFFATGRLAEHLAQADYVGVRLVSVATASTRIDPRLGP